MSTESSSAADDLRDRTRWVWIAIVLLVVIAAAAVWVMNSGDPNVSRVRVKHILIQFDSLDPQDRASAHETITRLRERIAEGISFEQLAREYSDDEMSARRGGDLGYLKRGILSDNVENYVWDAPLNTVSDIIETPFGFHLVVVVDRFFSSADLAQKELEERVLREMEEEKEAAPPASPAPEADALDATSAAPAEAPLPEATPAPAAPAPAPPPSIAAPPGQ